MATKTGPLRVRLTVSKRWWFGAARIITTVLVYCGFITDTERAAKWLTTHGMVFGTEVIND